VSDAVGSRVLIVGAAGFTNLGDDAILGAMLTELRELLPEAAFVVAGGPEAFPATPEVEWIQVRDVRAVDAAVARADLVIVGGGGFIYDYDAILTPYDFLRGDVTFMYPYYRAALAASARNVPVYFYGVGVDSLVTPVGRGLTRDVLSLAAAITVRDPISLLELLGAGVQAPLVEVTADPAVRAPPVTEPWGDRPEGRVVAFVTRPWLRWAGTWTSSAEQFYGMYVSWLAAAADHAVEAWSATPVFLPGQRYNDDDLETAAKVVERMAAGGGAQILTHVVDEQQYRAVLGGADVVVSSRLHPLILAAAAGVPVVGIAITEKVRAFLTTLGLDAQIASPWSASAPRLRRAVDSAFDERDAIRARMETGLVQQRRAAARNPEIACELLSGPSRERLR
jgi:polysaccharide pyruvyl transferase WcaK-like protein